MTKTCCRAPSTPTAIRSQTGDVPLDWYKRFFETALRLRMNMVAPYTRVHRRYEVQKLASDWGLYYTSHHYDILVSNPFGLDHLQPGRRARRASPTTTGSPIARAC